MNPRRETRGAGSSGRGSDAVRAERPLGRFAKRLGYAWAGIRYAWRTEAHFRLHCAAAAAVLLLAAALRLGPLEWAALLVCSALVIGAELVNTAVERAVDYAARGERHPLAKAAKDAAAGAVLAAAVFAAAVGAAVLGPPLWRLAFG